MKIQTERLENHTARFTVEVDAGRLDSAKKEAARKLAKHVNVPGFRRGKAPYRILASHIGEATIIEEAVEILGNDIYKQALDKEEIHPYGPGSLEDFTLSPAPTFTFTVPLQPETKLGDYRDVRVDYEAPEVSEEAVDEAMERLRQREALTEDTDEPASPGDRVTIDIHSEFIDGPEMPEDSDEDDEEAEDGDEEAEFLGPYRGDPFVHRHDATILLDPENEPVLPGFIAALTGASIGDEREFELDVPDDEEKYEDIAGRRVKLHITIKDIKKVTLPELDDAFAAKVTEGEEEPLTLEQLRARVRKDLEEEAERRSTDAYAGEVLEEIIDQAEISYPEMMVDDQIEDMLEDIDQRLRQQGITLDMYTKISGKTREDLGEEQRNDAEAVVRRMLVLRELIRAEGIKVTDTDIEAQLEKMLLQFGEQGPMLRPLLDTPQMRENMVNGLLQEKVLERIAMIGRGLAPEPDTEAETAAEAVEEAAETAPAADDTESSD